MQQETGIRNIGGGQEITLEGRKYRMMLTMSVMDALCEISGSSTEFIKQTQQGDEALSRSLVIQMACAMINDDIDRRMENGEKGLKHYTAEYMRKNVPAGQVRRIIAAAGDAFAQGMQDDDIAQGVEEESPNA